MASENKNEEVLLTGQNAYFKKNGSMTNYGELTLNNQETTNTYGPGFIDENSTIGAASLEQSSDYVDTLQNMRLYLGEDFISESEDYLVKANAENIINTVSPREVTLQKLVDNINKYVTMPYLECKNAAERVDILVSAHLKNNFIIEIKSNVLPANNEDYMLINNGDTLQLFHSSDGKYFLNGVEIENLDHTDYQELIISQENGKLYVEIDGNPLSIEINGFEGETDVVINTHFANKLYGINIYGEKGLTNEIVPRYNTIERKCGLHDLQSDIWYPETTEIKFYTEYVKCNIYSGALDLDYHPNPNTGMEIKYSQYSSQSTSNGIFRGIIGCFSQYSVSNAMTFGLLIGDGSRIYATRRNNIDGWVDSGAAVTVGGASNYDIITLNKNNDGLFKSTGAHIFSKSLSSYTPTISNTGGATLWLCGANDMGRYVPLDRVDSNSCIPAKNDIYIWYVKIYEGDKLVREYVPAADLNENKGMLDKVNMKFYKATKCSFSTYTS